MKLPKILAENASTFNMWCKGNSLPNVSKIQKLADYFKIMKSDLIDEKLDSDPMLDARILSDVETIEMIRRYYSLSMADRSAIRQIIDSLYEKKKAES